MPRGSHRSTQGDGAPPIRHHARQESSFSPQAKEHAMSITIGHLAPVVALIAGILILIIRACSTTSWRST
jgi:hypothetical protein